VDVLELLFGNKKLSTPQAGLNYSTSQHHLFFFGDNFRFK